LQEYLRRENETFFEWKLRLIVGKIEKTIDLDWIEIRDLLGLDCSPDHLRKTAYGIYEYYEYFQDKIEDGLTGDEILEEYEQKRLELEKSKIKFYDQKREFRKLLREQARFEHLKEELHKSIAELAKSKPLNFKSSIITHYSNREAVLGLADWHKGLFVQNYWNEFNNQEFERRIKRLVEKTIEYCKEQKVATLHVVSLGDLINGYIKVNARITNEEDVIKQTQSVAETIAEMLAEFAGYFGHIKFYSVVDNHSRLSPNKEDSITSENFMHLIPWYLNARLKHIPNIEIVDNDIDEEIAVINVCGKKIFATHGHRDSLKNIVQDLTLMLRDFPDYIMTGHLHHLYENEIHGVEVIMIPSLSGVDQYSKEIRKTNKPAQRLIIFDNFEGRLCTYNILLDIGKEYRVEFG